jgi:hypothetical protein
MISGQLLISGLIWFCCGVERGYGYKNSDHISVSCAIVHGVLMETLCLPLNKLVIEEKVNKQNADKMKEELIDLLATAGNRIVDTGRFRYKEMKHKKLVGDKLAFHQALNIVFCKIKTDHPG